jgi:RNA polymerase sigma-70 factor (ECF subfamily)
MKGSPKDAFIALVSPHVGALYRAGYRLTGNRPDAEDLFQEVCLRAYASLAAIGRVDQPRAWLLKVQYRLGPRR